MIQALIPAVVGLIGKAIDKAVPDKDEAEKLKSELTLKILEMNQEELKSSASIILAEVQGESWLQRSWRPILMLWFAALVGAHWFGFTPDNLSTEAIEGLFLLVQLGIGGYVVGRSAEKGIKEWKSQPK